MRNERVAAGPSDFALRTQAREATLKMILGGGLDMSAAFRLESSFDALLAAGEVRSVVLDLADVTLVDSAGIGALLSIRERAGQLGIGFAVSRVSKPVRRILDLTGVSETFDI
jgi:anti-anti-sigma factor